MMRDIYQELLDIGLSNDQCEKVTNLIANMTVSELNDILVTPLNIAPDNYYYGQRGNVFVAMSTDDVVQQMYNTTNYNRADFYLLVLRKQLQLSYAECKTYLNKYFPKNN